VHTIPRLAIVLCLSSLTWAQPSVLLDAMTDELNRNFKIFKEKADPAPYFLAYEVTDQEFASVSSSLGVVTSANQGRNRILDVSVRVGSNKLDNYHRTRGERAQFTAGVRIPIEDSVNGIKRQLWAETDRAYRSAAERLIKIKTSTQVKVTEEDLSDDFSSEESSRFEQPGPRLKFNNAEWSDRLRRISARFRKHPEILTSSVSLMAQTDNRYFVNTEGSRIQHGRGYARLLVSASAKADDGSDLSIGQIWEAVDPAGLPSDSVLESGADAVAKQVAALLRAPTAEPFVGPAIFSGRAAGVFFHEIFGHRIEGHRQKDESEGQTFTKSVNTKILPDFLSVVFDPTLRKAGGIDLAGWYAYDDEGVKARPVTVVENGVLKSFLMSRSPIRGFDKSNGHGRRQPGLEPVSRQSNLLVQSSKEVSDKQLRQMLVEEAKRQNKPYGLYFEEVTGGFTSTMRGGPQAFKVIPVVVYRVYADGRPDELVRGADIVGTPLASFAKILATSNKPEVFNGVCGAESGGVPVSAVSPAILVSEIEIEKKQKSQDRPPLMPAPETGTVQGGRQ
jgi:predicted Zn-dependent protease